VQAAARAPWQIVLVGSYSGNVWAATPPSSSDSFAPSPTPSAAHVNTLPSEYAAYLKSIKYSGQPPRGTRLAPGPFTDQLIASLYNPLSKQQADGVLHSTTYSVDPNDPVWQFAGSNGSTASCGTVRYVDVLTPAPGHQLVQQPGDRPFGGLPDGTYQKVTLRGLHMACFESYSDPTTPIIVFAEWGHDTTVTGSPIGAGSVTATI
jgi:hypothetical protein